MTEKLTLCCGTCYHFELEGEDLSGEEVGLCRRYAPRPTLGVIPWPIDAEEEAGMPREESELPVDVLWPRLQAHERCGEWRTK